MITPKPLIVVDIQKNKSRRTKQVNSQSESRSQFRSTLNTKAWVKAQLWINACSRRYPQGFETNRDQNELKRRKKCSYKLHLPSEQCNRTIYRPSEWCSQTSLQSTAVQTVSSNFLTVHPSNTQILFYAFEWKKKNVTFGTHFDFKFFSTATTTCQGFKYAPWTCNFRINLQQKKRTSSKLLCFPNPSILRGIFTQNPSKHPQTSISRSLTSENSFGGFNWASWPCQTSKTFISPKVS